MIGSAAVTVAAAAQHTASAAHAAQAIRQEMGIVLIAIPAACALIILAGIVLSLVRGGKR